MDFEVKSKPLTKEETKTLLELIDNSKIITSKATNATSNKLKDEEWIRITERFNATATNGPRKPQQLRLKWENLKKNSRKRSTKIRMNQIKTGGGPAEYIPPDDILDHVTSLLGSTASGFTVQFGGDRESEVFDVGHGESSGDGIGDVTVSISDFNKDLVSIPMTIDNGIETLIPECEVLDVVDQNVITPNKAKKLTFSTPRAVMKKTKSDESRPTRNKAIAEYYAAKKKCLYLKLTNMHLENESIKLKNIELKLKNEKLLLETEKLRLEIEKLKEQV